MFCAYSPSIGIRNVVVFVSWCNVPLRSVMFCAYSPSIGIRNVVVFVPIHVHSVFHDKSIIS